MSDEQNRAHRLAVECCIDARDFMAEEIGCEVIGIPHVENASVPVPIYQAAQEALDEVWDSALRAATRVLMEDGEDTEAATSAAERKFRSKRPTAVMSCEALWKTLDKGAPPD